MSSRVRDLVVTCPRDVRRGDDPVALRWVKRRLKCENADCPRRTFTERAPAVPPGRRLTPRLRERCAAEVADRGVTPAEAARHAGVSWPVAHDAFAARADAMPGAPALVAHLGIDERRRGRPQWERDEESGRYVQLADRWHVNFCDLSGRRACSARSRAAPPTTPRTGWPRPRPRGGTGSRSSPSTCARCSCPLSAATWRLSTCSTSCNSPSRRPATCAAGPRGRSTAGGGKKATPSTGSRACSTGTWRAFPRPSSARSSRPWTPTATARRSRSPGSRRRNCGTP